MHIFHFKCRLLSEVVLQQTTATEGFQDGLDYIPGVKFLGIAAKKLYDEKDNNTLDFFHNGKVQFGNAYPQAKCCDKPSVPVPFSWFKPKLEESLKGIFVRGSYEETKETKDQEKEKQPKQMRSGYIADGKLVKIDQGFSLKSAYDRKKRRSAEGRMYGYSSLPKDTLWQFTVRSEGKEYLEQVKSVLEGTHTIGRSRTAQYGLIEVSFLKEEEYQPRTIEAGEVWIYAKSDCAFFDKYGNPTFKPEHEQLGLPKGSKIQWDKSQIRTREYSVWNGKRNILDPRRSVISKGSAWVCKVEQSFSSETVELGVGSFQAEGLGQLLVNPDFLEVEGGKGELKKKVKQEALAKYQESTEVAEPDKTRLLEWLDQVSNTKISSEDIRQEADTFLKENEGLFKTISKSQWGHIRSAAKRFLQWNDFMIYLFQEDFGYTQHGVSESKWRSSGRAALLEEKLNKLYPVKDSTQHQYTQEQAFEFVQYFANQMSKKAND